MGTTADKLQSVLNSKNAIKNKFGLADDLPFSQYADAIKNNAGGGGTGGGGGTSAEMFLCNYVNRNYFSYNTLVVSGFPTNVFADGKTYDGDWNQVAIPADMAARNPNGTYVLTNPSETESYNRLWKAENGCCIKGTYLYPDERYIESYSPSICREDVWENDTGYPAKNDYTSYGWMKDWSTISGASVAVPEPPPVDEKYWMGYKLFQDDNGKWGYETELTKLAYADYMPVVGRIYDTAATMEIGNVDFSEKALWSCPHDMTSEENDEWKITASGQAWSGAEYAPINAFDADMESRWWSNSTSGVGFFWIQWQNKQRPVIIRELIIYCNDMNDFNDGSYFAASNDGEVWTDILRGKIGSNEPPEMGSNTYEDGRVKITVPLPNNGTAYSYYRLGKDFDKNNSRDAKVHKIIAKVQSSREVPK